MSTAWGRKYARLVHEGTLIWKEGVPETRRTECYQAYVEAGYQPPIDPPEN